MATEIYLVKVGMSMTEGVVEEWYIADGAKVETGELLYRLETEKVNLDVDAEASGIVKHLVAEGVTKEPGDVVGYIFAAGEEIPADLQSATSDAQAAQPATGSAQPTQATPARDALPSKEDRSKAEDGRILASPAARRLARELDIDYTELQGTGPGGRIVEADVQASANAATNTNSPSSPIARKLARELGVNLSLVTGTGPGGRITKDDVELAAKATSPATGAADTFPVRGMRKTIAQRMHDSLLSMAQLTMDMDVNMDDAIKLRNQLVDEWSDENIKPTYTDLVIRAAARALQKHPRMNASWGDKEIALHRDVNVGMAVALDEGLVVPVIKRAADISIKELAQESTRLAADTRAGNVALDDMQDGTFTVSALGMFGVDSFTPIINAPQAGILGVNRIREDIRWEAERPIKTQVMRLSLTWDHRVLDGGPAALFLKEIKDLLESPYRLLL